MKRTVGLTAFFSFMNLCEKKLLPLNVYAGLLHFKKAVFFEGVKKTIFPTNRKGRFPAKQAKPAPNFWLPLTVYYRRDAEAQRSG
ncbi:MAG TPA: hypothetical protein VFB72_11350 [Verrucomicrobiae bacterium]|nr:hypothetical protein [Verrucomicrobiae bacterium]